MKQKNEKKKKNKNEKRTKEKKNEKKRKEKQTKTKRKKEKKINRNQGTRRKLISSRSSYEQYRATQRQIIYITILLHSYIYITTYDLPDATPFVLPAKIISRSSDYLFSPTMYTRTNEKKRPEFETDREKKKEKKKK